MTTPLYAALLAERYSSTWWVTTEEADSALMQGIRRRALSEALDEEANNDDTEAA